MTKSIRDKIIGPLVLFILSFCALPYIYNSITDATVFILNYINPIYLIKFYLDKPLLFGAILGLLILYVVVSYETNNELVLEHEDQSRLANEEEIHDNFTRFDPYKTFKAVMKK